MMRSLMNNRITYSLFLVLAVMLAMSITAQAANDGYALLVQSSPPDGGVVSPGMGVLKMSIGQTVSLSATPKKGYRFLYWLGDVSSTTGTDTTVSIDSPKLIVAVFAREDFDEELPGIGVIEGQYGGGGGRFINPIRSPGSVNPAPPVFDFPSLPEQPQDQDADDDIPVPGDNNDDIPVPGDNEIPEPATVFLMGLGSTILLRRKRK